MKKLMIAAALAAAMVGTASAADDCAPCAWAYKMMLVAKTTVAGNVSNTYAKACGCYRKPTMGKLVGYVYAKGDENPDGAIPVGCGGSKCLCNSWDNGVIVLWKAWNKSSFPVVSLNWKQLDRIGYKDQSTVEAVFDLQITDPFTGSDEAHLTLAGFGKAAHRADGTVAIKSLNGYFAGQMLVYCDYAGTDYCGNEIPGAAPEPAQYFSLCDDTGATVNDDPKTAAYGKWQLIWDSQLLARFKKDGIPAAGAKPSAAYQDVKWLGAVGQAQ